MKSWKRDDVACVAVGTAALMCLGLGYGWSVFRGTFQQLYPQWTQMMLSLVFSFSMIFFGVGSFLCGLLMRRCGIREAMLLGTAVLCGGFWGVSYLPSLAPEPAYVLLLLLYGVLGGSGIGICYNAINSAVPKFFPRVKGTVSGVMMAGYGSGALVLGMAASRMLSSSAFGPAGTFRILAVVQAAVLILCMVFFERKDRAVRTQAASRPNAGWGFRPTEVLRTGSFWVLQLRNIFSYAACLIIIEQAGRLSEAFGMAATAGLVVSVANGLVRIPSGISCDRLGCVKTLRIGNLLLAGATVLLAAMSVRSGAAMFYLCFVLFGLSYGITPPVSVSINEEFFGPKYRTVNYAFFSFALAPASLLGPTVLGALHDRFGATVTVTCLTIAAYALAAGALSLWIRSPDGGTACAKAENCV